ncbi:MAG TPA: energy transducer TonB [Elusimicrobiota bacterium]|nr:energy transducer TonB [Elusimicrobiota bacterium]
MRSKPSLFQIALIASVGLHGGVWGAFSWVHRAPSDPDVPALEIDLTKPFRLDPNASLKRLGGGPSADQKPAVVSPPVPTPPTEKTVPNSSALPQEKTEEWKLPTADTKEFEKGTGGDESLPPGSGDGSGYGYGGEGDGVGLSRLPRLLNREEIRRNLQRFYPERERRLGQEGVVVVDVHIGDDGQVGRIEIVESGGESFDDAARAVVKEMRFSPAMVGPTPVAVKIRQSIVFRIE